MVRTVSSMARIAVVAAMVLSVVAIGLGRLSPGPEARTAAPGHLVAIATRYPGPISTDLQLLDVRDGTIRSVVMDRFNRVDLATGSPWVDGRDQAHVVGRWMALDADGALRDSGLARVSYPSGRFLDRVALERYPVAPPCWGSGTTARVVFASGDGALYRYDFEPSATPRGPGGGSALSAVRWRVEPPGGAPAILDVTRSEGLLAPDLVLATIVPRGGIEGRRPPVESEIWWLRLGPGDDEILDCGRVIEHDPEDRDFERRRPALGRRADGSLWLAYLSSKRDPGRMLLRIAPARIDEQTGAPRVDAKAGLVLADDCLAVTPSFTEGGTRLTCLTDAAGTPTALRIPLADAPSPTALAVAGMPPGL